MNTHGSSSSELISVDIGLRTSPVDCTLVMSQLGWAHFAGKGRQSEAEAILAEVSADDVERMRSSENIGGAPDPEES
jgi:hypothetical protein